MDKQFVRSLLFIVAVVFAVQTVGCGPPKTVTRTRIIEVIKQPYEKKKPQAIDIMIRVKDWRIIQNRALNYHSRLGEIRFAGRYAYNQDLVFKFKSDKYPDCYWLAKIPSVREGKYEIRAIPYFEDDSPNIIRLDEPPKKFAMSLRIKDGRIHGHFIKDYNPRWGKFKLLRFKHPIVYFRNAWYPGREWAARLPTEDGSWTIYPTLIN